MTFSSLRAFTSILALGLLPAACGSSTPSSNPGDDAGVVEDDDVPFIKEFDAGPPRMPRDAGTTQVAPPAMPRDAGRPPTSTPRDASVARDAGRSPTVPTGLLRLTRANGAASRCLWVYNNTDNRNDTSNFYVQDATQCEGGTPGIWDIVPVSAGVYAIRSYLPTDANFSCMGLATTPYFGLRTMRCSDPTTRWRVVPDAQGYLQFRSVARQGMCAHIENDGWATLHTCQDVNEQYFWGEPAPEQ